MKRAHKALFTREGHGFEDLAVEQVEISLACLLRKAPAACSLLGRQNPLPHVGHRAAGGERCTLVTASARRRAS